MSTTATAPAPPDTFPEQGGCDDLAGPARLYYERGLSVIPLDDQKKSVMPWKRFQASRARPRTLGRWFGGSDPRVVGVGVICGRNCTDGSILAVRDWDVPEHYEAWRADHPDLAEALPTVRTPRGWHVWTAAAAELFLDCGDGEYRGTSGQYVVAPPSRNATGRYTWVVPLPDGPLPVIDPVPAGLIRESMLHMRNVRGSHEGLNEGRSEIGRGRVAGNTATHHSPSLEARIQEAIATTLPTGPGQRHHRVFDLARTLRSIPEVASLEADRLFPVVKRWQAQSLAGQSVTSLGWFRQHHRQ